MAWQDQVNGDPLSWLLEDDTPAVQYLAMRDLEARPADDPEMVDAQRQAYTEGPIAAILDAMEPEGYWVRPGPGYNPKYRSLVWSLTALSQMGATIDADPRIATACNYTLDHTLMAGGRFSSTNGPSGTIDCLQGNLCAALLSLGCDDPRLDDALEWMARSVTGEGVAPAEDKDAPLRYYAYKSGPVFQCGINNDRGCGWGAIKVMVAFGKLPPERRTPLIERAIVQGIDFLLSVNPADATYPTKDDAKPSRNWWKFGFPVFYVADLLQNVEALAALGYGADPRLADALAIIHDKQDEQGRWALEYHYTGKTWADFGPKREPNKWVTLRALRTLKAIAA
jgi:hypothetical protein